MGYSVYSVTDREARSVVAGYATKSRDEIFVQQKERRIHDSMDPKKAILRESRDSETHPLSVPIIIALDVTGSMRTIPHQLVKDGLPKLMSAIMQKGIKDPQILFVAVGDCECDSYPLQVGQFESGDEELDLWLTRTYLEGGGGGNAGESYNLAYAFAGMRTQHDAWDKRKQKGFLFTIGDEPCLPHITSTELRETMNEPTQKTFSTDELLTKAKEKYHVYHLHVLEGSAGVQSLGYWKELLRDNCIEVAHSEDIPGIISDIVTKEGDKILQNLSGTATDTKEEEIIL
ncbi:MAG TPA: hypothetical protein PKY82_25780 [Pyrinomonadaceae bacterium]|nr:hypothetical protein [Pyrinomonadaceae bacterium]